VTPADVFLFSALPYAAVALFAVGTWERFRRHPFSCTSHSSQFLENTQHFWGIVPFHAGILVVLAAHVLALTVPSQIAGLTAYPRLLGSLEVAGLAFGLLATGGFASLMLRRATEPKVRMTTGAADVVVFAILFLQLASGVVIALRYAWGLPWYGAVAVPYLKSLVMLAPDAAAIATMPLLVKLHIASAWVLLGLFPFSRLVHILAVPNAYLWRRPQVVRWAGR
jgi:nitrate reductase gamma subunit